MVELKKQLVAACERKLDYYDIVNESAEMVEYGLIVDFLFEQIAGLMAGGDQNEHIAKAEVAKGNEEGW